MSEQEEKKNKRIAMATSIGVHVALFHGVHLIHPYRNMALS
jgi:hypothetical protein